ncbi:GNAT family N-acetyltransferase [Paenibacillus brevis]|uniref:GNAT family N-acetyltransferase n=1 Tax=Paenibacillus brevis TaxID=2841508 RepID=A0ABS6FP94_9BACL|nr:GNAT family N-acetyltransferase [Paenibacillus brevis]MBU5672022.1 GNAT family N-acetyltransferase [Paenibacillus brevis]
MLIHINSEPVEPAVQELMEIAAGFDLEQQEEMWSRYRSGREAELYAYQDNEEWIGLIGIEMLSPERMDIMHLAIRPEDRLKGYGRGLILEAIILKKPKLVTAVTDEEGADFFRNIGFSVTGFFAVPEQPELFRCVYEAEE